MSCSWQLALVWYDLRMETKIKSTRVKVAPRGWSARRTAKISAIEGLVLSPRMERAIAPGGDEGRRNALAVTKKS